MTGGPSQGPPPSPTRAERGPSWLSPSSKLHARLAASSGQPRHTRSAYSLCVTGANASMRLTGTARLSGACSTASSSSSTTPGFHARSRSPPPRTVGGFIIHTLPSVMGAGEGSPRKYPASGNAWPRHAVRTITIRLLGIVYRGARLVNAHSSRCVRVQEMITQCFREERWRPGQDA